MTEINHANEIVLYKSAKLGRSLIEIPKMVVIMEKDVSAQLHSLCLIKSIVGDYKWTPAQTQAHFCLTLVYSFIIIII